MKAKVILPFLLLTTLFTASGSEATTCSSLSSLVICVDSTSSTQISLSWNQPASSTDFVRYELYRAVPAFTISSNLPLTVGAFFLLLGGLFLLRRRKVLQQGLLVLGVCFLGSFTLWQAYAGAFLDFKLLTTYTDFAQMTHSDTSVVAGEGYYYKVLAVFGTGSSPSDIVFGRAEDPTVLPQPSGLIVSIDSPQDLVGSVQDPSLAVTVTIDAPLTGRAVPTGILKLNGTTIQTGITGTFSTTVNLKDGPNFLELTGTLGTESITVARLVSLAGEGLGGQLLHWAFSMSLSPKPQTGLTLLEEFRQEFNAQTATDWNDLFGQLTYPIDVCFPGNDPNNPPADPTECTHAADPNSAIKLDASFTDVALDADGSVQLDKLELVGVTTDKVVMDMELLVDGISMPYSKFVGEIKFSIFYLQACPDKGLNRMRFGRVRMRVRAEISIATGLIQATVTDLAGGSDIVTDEGGTGDPFDTDRLWGGACGPFATDTDDQIFGVVNSSLQQNNPLDLGDTTFTTEPNQLIPVTLTLAQLSQDPDNEGVVIRFDAAVGDASVTFPFTGNPAPDGASNGSLFPDSLPGELGSSFDFADDLINQSLAASLAAGLLTGSIEDELKVGTTTVPLRVGDLDPGTPDALLPGLRDYAPNGTPVRIDVRFSMAPVVGIRQGPARASGGLDLYTTGFQADVLVDVDLDGVFDGLTEKATSFDFDVWATSDVIIDQGAAKFILSRPVEGYQVMGGGFLSLPHASGQAMATAIIDDRFTRILDLVNGVGGSGLLIPGIQLDSVDTVADGPGLDYLTGYGATSVDLKVLLEWVIDLLNQFIAGQG